MSRTFIYKDNTFNIITVNRQESFYYKITKPHEVWGNHHAAIAFFDYKNSLVYHRNGCFAHSLQSGGFVGFVKWSKTGNIALFYEFRRGAVPGDGIYDYIILDLKNKKVYRVDQNKYSCNFIEGLEDHEFDDLQLLDQLHQLQIIKEECWKDKITITPFRWLTGVKRWRP